MLDLVEVGSPTGTRAARRCSCRSRSGYPSGVLTLSGKISAPAIADGIEPGGEALSAEQLVELIGGWFPELGDPAARSSTWPLIAPHHDRIKDWPDADVTVATIAQRLRDEHQAAASESSVRRWIATHFREEMARERVTVPRGPVNPGVRGADRLRPAGHVV